MKYYYAIFSPNEDPVEVEFPDLRGCVTFGNNWDESMENATDVLTAWLANAENQYIKKTGPFEKLQDKYGKANLIPIALDEKILRSYEELRRFNVIFPSKLLKKVDQYRKRTGLKRSTLLKIATEEYLDKLSSNSAHSN